MLYLKNLQKQNFFKKLLDLKFLTIIFVVKLLQKEKVVMKYLKTLIPRKNFWMNSGLLFRRKKYMCLDVKRIWILEPPKELVPGKFMIL